MNGIQANPYGPVELPTSPISENEVYSTPCASPDPDENVPVIVVSVDSDRPHPQPESMNLNHLPPTEKTHLVNGKATNYDGATPVTKTKRYLCCDCKD